MPRASQAARRRGPRSKLGLALGCVLVLALLAAGSAVLATTEWGSGVLLSLLAHTAPRGHDAPAPSDQVIIVLTGRMERVDKAAMDSLRSGLPIYIAGDPFGVMARHLHRTHGLEARWTDRLSVDTETNAAVAACVLQREGIHSIALVTDAWHMPRSVLWFRYYGFEVTPTPAPILGPTARPPSPWPDNLRPSDIGRLRARVFVHESAGIAEYYLFRFTHTRHDCEAATPSIPPGLHALASSVTR